MDEAGLEGYALDLFAEQGWQVMHGPDVAPGQPDAERDDWREVVLPGRLRDALARLNPSFHPNVIDEAVRLVLRPDSQSVFRENWRAYQLLVGGVPVDFRVADGSIRHHRLRLVDWADPIANDLLVMNQVTVMGKKERRPDVVVYVNGLPLALFELKRSAGTATLSQAHQQVQTYVNEIPVAFTWNQLTVVSDGVQARAGTFTSPYEHFAPWKTIDGVDLAPGDLAELEVLIKGLFRPDVFLDVIRNFVVFSDEFFGARKKVAKYHQYWAVRKAITRTIEAKDHDGRAGVVWHTQGSGKSLEMHCFTGAIMRHPAMANPTVVVITDRNDLDNQLFEEVFASSRPNAPLPGTPVQADSRDHLKALLSTAGAGGIYFTTIQKFGLSSEDRAAGRSFPMLSGRDNIVVMVDEAHRSNYDFIDGFARHLRDALPHAVYMGFTGTPIELGDKSTVQVFGDYIDVYDLTQAVEDGATVKVYYEARLAKVELPPDALDEIDEAFEDAVSETEDATAEQLKTRWSKVEAVVGSEARIKELAADLVEHWEDRREVLAGKCMVVAMSRRIAAQLYDEIIALRPDWHSEDDELGKVKVVITGSASDPLSLQPHIRSKQANNLIKARAKNPSDMLEMVIVRDMWLTGFDAPPMHTMYVDKPMRGASLMQAITRINRTFKDKPAGLVVDYIGIADDLKAALQSYTKRDRDQSTAGQDIRESAIPAVIEKHEVVCTILSGYDWRAILTAGDNRAFLNALTGTVNYLLAQHTTQTDGSLAACDEDHRCLKCRFLDQSKRLVALYTICATAPEVVPLRDDVAFFDAVRSQIIKIEGPDRTGPGSDAAAETAIKQIVSQATSGVGVVDIYEEAGLKAPDISVIDESFLEHFAGSGNKELTIEMVRRLIDGEIRNVGRRNIVAGRKFSEMLQRAILLYQNRSLDSAQIMRELVTLAEELQAQRRRGEETNLSEAELAFYDAIVDNESAEDLGDETLRKIAHELVRIVREDATTDWTVKEQIRAKLRASVRRLLMRFGYPPDDAESATQLVLEQAEAIAAEGLIDA